MIIVDQGSKGNDIFIFLKNARILKGYGIYTWIVILTFNIHMGYYITSEMADCLKCTV